jgi:hypothetical protein
VSKSDGLWNLPKGCELLHCTILDGTSSWVELMGRNLIIAGYALPALQ